MANRRFRRTLTATLIVMGALLGSPSLAAVASPSTASPHVERAASRLTSVQRWAAQKYGTFATKRYSGTGDDVLTLPKGVKAAVVTVVTHGDSNFVVWTLNRDNTERELVANDIGAFTSTGAFGLQRRSTARAMKVEADGSWRITVKPVRTAGSISGSHEKRGVFLYGGGAARLAAKAHGDSNFVIWQYGSPTGATNLVVNEIAPTAVTGLLYRGPSVLEVEADASWSAHIR